MEHLKSTMTPLPRLRRLWRSLALLACCLGALLPLGACNSPLEETVVEFWTLGSEGEAVRTLLPKFERTHPSIRIKLQQIPWIAAHEKLLTAYAGDALPDLLQLGNTWIPEFAMLGAIGALDTRISTSLVIHKEDYFPGILATNDQGGHLYGLPWYVDTRLLFYRKDILAQAGFAAPPTSWSGWLDAMRKIRELSGGRRYAILLPINEWEAPTLLAMQLGADLLRDDARYGHFQGEEFRRAFAFCLGLYRERLAPALATTQLSNLYRDFGQGQFAMYITGPWNLGEFSRRLPESLQDVWTTAPLPAPDGVAPPGGSLAGGSSLAIAVDSTHQTSAWKLLEFLSTPEQQAALYRLSGDLPARRSAYADPALASDPRLQAFLAQLERAVASPAIPEWERIAAKLGYYLEKVVRGSVSEDTALALLDGEVDAILEKRRWLLAKQTEAGP